MLGMLDCGLEALTYMYNQNFANLMLMRLVHNAVTASRSHASYSAMQFQQGEMEFLSVLAAGCT